ncbi:MAG: Na+/H+ antiporter NhaA [Actinomycetota bacterium]|nr:Na+/H+ antiporter NhaA [Actinomycetota bacterium]
MPFFTVRRHVPVVDRLLAPLREFIQAEASGGVLLLAATAVALLWANSPLGESYRGLWQTELRVAVGTVGLAKSLQVWINDGLMAIFFLVVGLEIKRELLVGELASLRRALLPVAAATGGAAVPATLYILVTIGTDAVRGWGVAMATDIAFALGLLALLGSRVPMGLKVFVTALAIVDDILAVVAIAIFYSGDLSLVALAAAAAVVAVLVLCNLLGVRRPVVYAVLGIVLWLAVLQSGVHATVAGVVLAATIPATTRLDSAAFSARAEQLLDAFRRAAAVEPLDVRRDPDQQAALWELEAAAESVQAPMQRLEHALHPWVAFVIVPLFALANAGVSFFDSLGAALVTPAAYGVVLGLVVGKQLGIVTATWIVVRLGAASLPDGVGWRHIWGGGVAAGIGFTMSLFIAELAFAGDPLLEVIKVAILTASVLAAVGGWVVLSRQKGRVRRAAVQRV